MNVLTTNCCIILMSHTFTCDCVDTCDWKLPAISVTVLLIFSFLKRFGFMPLTMSSVVQRRKQRLKEIFTCKYCMFTSSRQFRFSLERNPKNKILTNDPEKLMVVCDFYKSFSESYFNIAATRWFCRPQKPRGVICGQKSLRLVSRKFI